MSLGLHADENQLTDPGTIQKIERGKIKHQVMAGPHRFLRDLGQHHGFALEAQSSETMDYRDISQIFCFG